MHNTASKYFCSVLYFRGCCLVFVTCLVLYLWQSGLRLREAEPLGKTWTGLISRHWREEKRGDSVWREVLQKYGGDQELDEDQYQRPNLEIHLYDLSGKTWIRLISRHCIGERRGMTGAWWRCCKVMVDTTTPMPRSSQFTKNNTWGRHWGEKGDDCILAGFPNASKKVFLP